MRRGRRPRRPEQAQSSLFDIGTVEDACPYKIVVAGRGVGDVAPYRRTDCVFLTDHVSVVTSAGDMSKPYADPAARCHMLRSRFCVAPLKLRYAKLRLGCYATFAQDDTRGGSRLVQDEFLMQRLTGMQSVHA